MRRVVYEKKRDQRELIKVAQRNFRKYMSMRDWGWFVIIQKTRPLIGMPNPEEELRLLEEQANNVYGKYDEQLQTKARLLEENVAIEEEKKQLLDQLQKEQGNLSVYHEKQAKATAGIADLEGQLATAQETLVQREQARQDAMAEKKVLEQECVAVKKDIEDVEIAIQKIEQEKTNRDHTIRSLNDEIANQDEVINKLNKEKKHVSENAAKSMEDLQVAEEKVNHLGQIKNKLEGTLDELEGSYEKEKRSKANLEKERRKVEGELKVMQETVADLERSKKELEGTIQQKKKMHLLYSANLMMNKHLLQRFRKASRKSRQELKVWKKNLRLKDKAAQKQRGKDLTFPESLKISMRDLLKLPEQLVPRLS